MIRIYSLPQILVSLEGRKRAVTLNPKVWFDLWLILLFGIGYNLCKEI